MNLDKLFALCLIYVSVFAVDKHPQQIHISYGGSYSSSSVKIWSKCYCLYSRFHTNGGHMGYNESHQY